jgi:hypothetical protein
LNVKAAKDWYYSEAYQSVTKHRKQGAIYHGPLLKVSANPRTVLAHPGSFFYTLAAFCGTSSARLGLREIYPSQQ